MTPQFRYSIVCESVSGRSDDFITATTSIAKRNNIFDSFSSSHILKAVDALEKNGPRGDGIVFIGTEVETIEIYIKMWNVSAGDYVIFYAIHTTYPTEIYLLTVYHRNDLPQGLDSAREIARLVIDR